jgi:crotonobetainyl-CoA:carnitine CoA-transferase CaiB-like acyl-CoA transferase
LEHWKPRELYQKLLELKVVEEFNTQLIFPCLDGYVCIALQGAGGAPVKSSREIIAWANAEGYAHKIKDYDWGKWDSKTILQTEQKLLESEIAPFLLTKTKAELLEQAAKRRILLAPVNTVADLPKNPQLSHRGYWQEVPHRELNEILTYPGPSVKVDQCPQIIYRKAPRIGEHNKEIYIGELEMSEEELTVLKGQGVI